MDVDRSDGTAGPGKPRRSRPRVRITVRGLLLLVALSALAMLVYLEVKDGMPPRFVVRGIPARVARLRPGMTRPQVKAVLGMRKPWYAGGTGHWKMWATGDGRHSDERYYLRGERLVAVDVARPGGPPGRAKVWRSAGSLRLRFQPDPPGGPMRLDASDRLDSATFSDDSGTVAEMPMDSKQR